MATKRTRSKMKRVKRTKRSLKRRSFKNTKRQKRTKRKKRTQINRRTKRMKGGAGGTAVETPPEGECVKKESKSGLWRTKYVKIESNSLNVYELKGGIPTGEIRKSSIPDLKGVSVTVGREKFPTLFQTLNKLIITNGVNMKGGIEQVELAFTHDFQGNLRGTQIMNNIKEAIENISAGREWNVGAEAVAAAEAVSAAKIKEVHTRANEIMEAKKKEDLEIMKARKEFSFEGDNSWKKDEKRLKSLLNELLPVTIESINAFNRGESGLIIVVTIEGGGTKILKITIGPEPHRGAGGMVDPCDNEMKEYGILRKVNEIEQGITGVVYSFTCITDLRSIVGLQMLLKQLEDNSSKYFRNDKRMIKIPNSWAPVWSDGQVLSWDPRDLSFAIVVMEYVDGVPLEEFKESTDIGTLKRTLEDFRKKINLLHSRGIYHCDLHNNNVIVQKSDNSVRIIDFGEAKEIDPSELPEWGEGTICGTAWKKAPPAEDLVEINCPEPWNGTAAPCISD
jgi:predicted Ser/Thr protein kinase